MKLPVNSFLFHTLSLTRRGESVSYLEMLLLVSCWYSLSSHEVEVTPDLNKTGKVIKCFAEDIISDMG